MSQQARSLLSLSVVSTSLIAQYRGVTYTGGQVAAANVKCIGIAERPTTVIGEIALVTTKGTAIAEAGGAITIGSALAFDAAGKVVMAALLAVAAPTMATGSLAVSAGLVGVTASVANGAGSITGTPTASAPVVTGGDLPQYIVGYALQAATTAGDLIEILMN